MSELQARVGIVMRTRDRPLFVVRALRAVLAQTHPDWHIALVNDGGDPIALRDRIALDWLAPRLPPARMTIIDTPESVGRASAFNLGLAALDTDFVACLDDDDSWEPTFLADLVAFYHRTHPLMPDLRGVAARVTAIREDVVTDEAGVQKIVRLGEDSLPNAFLRSDFLLGPIAYAAYRHDVYPVQWLLERQAAADLGGFPAEFEVMEDRAFLLRFLQHWRIATLDRPLAFHHRRVRRTEDVSRSAEMNTLDNPSYDWRFFSDLALPALNTPPGAERANLPALIRAVGASVVKELNDETSALWHKINGEAAGLRARLEALEGRLLADRAPAEPAPPPDPDAAAWSLWAAVGPSPIGYPIGIATPVLGRLTLSHGGVADGLLIHADPDRRDFVLQVPDTGAWCALELSLDGLAAGDAGLVCDLALGLPQGGLFETALVVQERDGLGRRRHAIIDSHVHSATSGLVLSITRQFGPQLLRRGAQPKLSIVLPRQARNFRLRLNELVVRLV
jgi:glycosyltransferase involved in cell wall biosynthesis